MIKKTINTHLQDEVRTDNFICSNSRKSIATINKGLTFSIKS